MIHGNKYDYSRTEYKGSGEKVCIICPEHGEFWQTPKSHLNGSGCPKCARKIVSIKNTLNTKEFIKKAQKIHGDTFDYSKVNYINNKTKVCIICHEKDENGVEHGEFWQTPSNHVYGCGCPKCKNEKRGLKRRLTLSNFINKAQQIHGNKYDYSKVDYKNSSEKVCIICPVHGEFWQLPYHHLKGCGCPFCNKEKYHEKRTYKLDDFILLSNKTHENKYEYSKVEYVNSKTKVCIICPKHGEFWQTPEKHLIGQGCPKCGIQLSNSENEIKEFLKNECVCNIIENSKCIISPYELDIYVPDKKVAIEYDGLIWHSEKFGKDKTYHLMKTELCEKQGIRLIHIFEDEWLEHKEIVKSKLRHILGCNGDIPKVYARKCPISEIDNLAAKDFLEKNHIQGFVRSSVYLGCFCNEQLVGVMSFKKDRKDNDNWELTRFVTDINYVCCGVGGKLFKYFIKNYNPFEIKSFADRRWTSLLDKTLYDNLEFKLDKMLKPDYSYVKRDKRLHKFSCRKEKLLKNYPAFDLNEDMTEREMTEKVGLYRIWNCGLLKYIYNNKQINILQYDNAAIRY